MVAPLALAGISTAFGLIQSLTRRSEKASEVQSKAASFADEARQNVPAGKRSPDVEALFKALDGDASGGITMTELSGALSKAAESGGKGRQGVFARETFGALLALQEKGQSGSETGGLLDKVFARLDANGDQQISQEELIAGLPSSRAREARKDGLEALFNAMDKDKDGKISFDEMKIALQQMRDDRERKTQPISGDAALTTAATATDTTATTTG